MQRALGYPGDTTIGREFGHVMRLVRRGCGESRLLTIAVFVRGSPGIRLFDELVMDSSCISHMIADHMPRGESGRLG